MRQIDLVWNVVLVPVFISVFFLRHVLRFMTHAAHCRMANTIVITYTRFPLRRHYSDVG